MSICVLRGCMSVCASACLSDEYLCISVCVHLYLAHVYLQVCLGQR